MMYLERNHSESERWANQDSSVKDGWSYAEPYGWTERHTMERYAAQDVEDAAERAYWRNWFESPESELEAERWADDAAEWPPEVWCDVCGLWYDRDERCMQH